jgi:hypothetical protein
MIEECNHGTVYGTKPGMKEKGSQVISYELALSLAPRAGLFITILHPVVNP